ncbi:Ubiquitin-protein ligase [Geranomyces michiganensis]|nr:Ubiquitin-protein ligase [Geranomyces michiganensis]
MWSTAMDVHTSPVATAMVQPTIAESDDADDVESRAQATDGTFISETVTASVPIDTSTTVPIVVHDETGHQKAAEKRGKRRASREELNLAKKHDEEEQEAVMLHSTGEGAISNIVQPTHKGGKTKVEIVNEAAVATTRTKHNAREDGVATRRANKDHAKGQTSKNAVADMPASLKKKHRAGEATGRKPRKRSSDSVTLDPAEHAAKMAALASAADAYDSELAALEVKVPEAAQRRRRRAPILTDEEKADAHRHFHNLHPTTNKLVGVKWHNVETEIHERKVNKARSTIDTTAPRTYSHLDNKRKAQQIAMERQAQIDRDNQILLENMAGIMKMEKKQYDQLPSPMRFAHSMHSQKRARDAAQIDKDNQGILHRLRTRESFYPHAEHLASRRQHLHYLTNIASYPARFRHEKAEYDTLTKTHTRCHDPTLGSERQQQLIRDWTSPTMTGYVAPKFKGAAHARHPLHATTKIPVADTDVKFTQVGGNKTPPRLPGITTSSEKNEREPSPAPAEPVTVVA